MDKSKAYSVLGLPDGAGEDQVKAAYKELAQKYNVDQYDAGPLRDEANQKMSEINEAFDALMSYLRTGSTVEASRAATPQSHTVNPGQYQNIRAMINGGRVDEALAALAAIPGGAGDAEWNFLMGSAYYYKGWLDQALGYFQQAVRLAPGNREYEAALRNLQGNQNGNMQGDPFNRRGADAQALGCACDTCTLMCCMDACCGVCRGM
ncbi:DnaJ domain-containing protein [Ruminococcaceae bacterium OttesenSCG-928-A11]|nr:DnaJ domain-containing protein [Ruminococcaceae bacterium OttesenSCG-928-A11]